MSKDVSKESFEVRTFGEKLRELRKMADLKQIFFEGKGYRKNSLSMFENNHRQASLEDRKKLVDIVRKSSKIEFDYDYYCMSAPEELEMKVNQYRDTLYDDYEAFTRAVNKALVLKMDQLAVELHYEKGKRHYDNRQFRESLREYMNALKYVKNSKPARPEIYKSMADSFQVLNELSACEVYLQLALDINRTDKDLRFRCLYAMAKVYIDLKDNERCEYMLERIYQEYEEPIRIMYADMVKASALRNTGSLDESIEFAKRKLEESPLEYRDYWLHNLSFYCSENGDYEQAIKYLNLTLEIRKEISTRTMSLNMLADTYIKIQEYDKAEKLLDEIHDIIIQVGDVFHMIKWYENKIILTEKSKKYGETEELMSEVLITCGNYTELKIWYVKRIRDILNIRIEDDDYQEKHCESVHRMMSKLS